MEKECIINLRFDEMYINALVDSGSTDCFVSEKFFKKLPKARSYIFKLKKSVRALVANGQTFECQHAININLMFFGETVPVIAYVSPGLPYKMILGYHFLVRNKFVINFETMHVSLKSD
jgi:hypothetical protein